MDKSRKWAFRMTWLHTQKTQKQAHIHPYVPHPQLWVTQLTGAQARYLLSV